MTHSKVENLFPSGDGAWSGKLWAILIVVCGALFLDGLDSAMIGVAVPEIQDCFGVAPRLSQWVISAYVLGFGGFLLFAGRLADAIGRRDILLSGVALLFVGSVAGMAANDVWVVIAARFVMGIGAALTSPAGLAIIATAFPEGPQRSRAIGIYTTCGAVGFSAGLLGGGLLTEFGWRWVFGLSVAMAFGVGIGTLWIIPRDRPVGVGLRASVPASFCLTSCMLGVIYLLIQAPVIGWTHWKTLLVLGLVIAFVFTFVFLERRSTAPLYSPDVVGRHSVVSAAIFSAAIMGCYTAFQFVCAFYLQRNLAWSPFQMALGLVPLSLLVALLGPRVGKVIEAIGAEGAIAVGFALYVLAYGSFTRIGDSGSYMTVVLPTVLLIGLAFPLSFSGTYVLATSGISDKDQGLASAVAQTGYQFGSALVLAIVAAVVSSSAGVDQFVLPTAALRRGVYVIFAIALLTFAYSLLTVVRVRRQRPTATDGSVLQ